MNEHLTKRILAKARSSLEPTRADRERMQKKVMAAVGAAAVVTAAASTAANAVSSGIPSLVATVSKVLIGGLIIGGVAGVAVVLTDRNEEISVDAPAVIDGPSGLDRAPARRKPRPARTEHLESAATPPVGSVSVDNQPSTRDPGGDQSVVRTKSSQVKAAPMSNDDALLREIALIKSASSMLARGEPRQALGILDEYDRGFKDGVMRQEHEGLRILGLCDLGLADEAKKARRRFEKQYPTSPLLVRIEESCRHLDTRHE